jgi:hypothetical protein
MEQEQQTPGQRALELVRLLLPNWQPTPQEVLRWIRIALAVGIVILGVLLILDVIGLLFGIALLNLLKILALPITVGAAVPLLNSLQKNRELMVELEVEDQRAQDGALQAYLDQMGDLILHENLRQSKNDDNAREARTIARARTLTVLSRPDGSLKASVVQFLYESELIIKGRVVLDLSESDLGYANLRGANLRNADFSGPYFRMHGGANLRGADLYRARGIDVRAASAYLRDTIMPDGEKAAESPLLEMEEGPAGEDGENTGPS